MTRKQFDKNVLKIFTPVLAPHGFESVRSRRCTFYRQVGDVFHIIIPDRGTRGSWYDIRVFPASPLIDPIFHQQFPDDLGIPTDSWSLLSEHGVGLSQAQFGCRDEERFANRFEKSVRPLLESIAIPYLNQFTSIATMIDAIKHPMFLGPALHEVGRVEEARPILLAQRDRLAAIDSNELVVTARLERIEELLRL